MEKERFATGATVLPILGIAGIGKTAVAQLVYNDPAVKGQFDYLIWIWVSNSFDAMQLTKDMLASVSQETHVGLCNFTKLQETLESRIKSKRVLLILDDVWDGITDYQWNQLLAPFNSDNVRGNMVIVTTRKPCVAKRRGTVGHIKLEALESDDLWLIFEARAFRHVNYEKQESLRGLGKKVAQQLKGNPLAAETAGALLREHHTVGHWTSMLMNEDWKSLKLNGGIMSALKLCYDRLPYHLQKCFTYCSLFRDRYTFSAEELVCIWISQGFVKRNSSSKRLEEIGQDYLDDLVNLGFFEKFKDQSLEGYTPIHYAMYDLMHDFARLVSRTECATIDGLQCDRMFPTVRHLSIIIDQMEDQTGNIAHRKKKFDESLQNTVTSVEKLRSLVLLGHYDSSCLQLFQTAFQKAHNLRLLHLSTVSPDFCSFLCNLVYPANLRYVTLETEDQHEHVTLPQVLSNSFHLQSLCVNSGEPQILPFLERLRCLTRLKLSSMPNVTEVSVPSLEELVLYDMPKLKTCTSVGDLKSSLWVLKIQRCPVLEVLDLFQKAHHNNETEQNSWLPSLKELVICDCPKLDVMIPLPSSATNLVIRESNSKALIIEANNVRGECLCEIILDEKFLSFHGMKDLKYLEIGNWRNIATISLRNFGHLISLKSLIIRNCNELLCSDEDLIPSNASAFPSLESVRIESCGITGKLLSLMLWHSPTLKELYLCNCQELTQLQIEEDKNIQSNLISASEDSSLRSSAPDGLCLIPLNLTSSLKKISIVYCPSLIFSGSRKDLFAGFTSLEKLEIWDCPELLSSLVHNDGQENGRCLLPQSLEELIISGYSHETLRPCFVDNLTHLKKLQVRYSPSLKSLQLDSCTAMEYLGICNCSSLSALEGLRSLVDLGELVVVRSPVLASLDTSAERLKSLHISELSPLTTPFFQGLTSLRSLSLEYLKEAGLTDEQERALLLHGSLQELVFFQCPELVDLPARLHSLLSLKTLKIDRCECISGLPNEGLPPLLEELEIEGCSYQLSAQCRSLAAGRLRVKIDRHYV